MHSAPNTLYRTIAILLLAGGVSYCDKADPEGDAETETSSEQAAEAPADADQGTPSGEAPVKDYLNLYCQSVGNLQLKADISQELSYMCQDGAPTDRMKEFRQRALDQEPGVIELTTLESSGSIESNTSEFLIAWSFHVPIRPFEVKSRPIYDFVAQNYDSETITLASESTRKPDDVLTSGLHLWSVDMNYNLTIKATASRFLESQRNTEYNLYQVLSGNEEMGLGVEHLIDTDNPDFSQSTMVNISFNDGDGFNDGNGGTVVITLLHFELTNHGFPETADASIHEIAKHTAQVMYDGLKQ